MVLRAFAFEPRAPVVKAVVRSTRRKLKGSEGVRRQEVYPRPLDESAVKKFLKRLLFLLALLLVGGALAIILLPPNMSPAPRVTAVFQPEKSAFGEKRSLNILLLGVDYNYDSKAQRHTSGARSDTILLIRVEPLGQALTMLSLPRDLLVGLGKNGTQGQDRINAAYSYGGEALAIATVEHVTGLKIDHHVVVKSDVVEELVDAIGGVPIEVEKKMDWDDNWAGLHIHLKPGPQRLSGTNAVGYCRFRQDEEGDFGRIRRQQKFLGALLKELKKKEHWDKYPVLAKIFRAKMKTDLKDEQLIGLATIYRSFPLNNIRKGRPEVFDYFDNGAAYLVLAPGEPRRTVEELFPPLPDPSVKSVKVLIEAPSDLLPEARRIGKALRERGFGGVRIRHLKGANPGGATTIVSSGIEGKPLESLRDTFPQIKVQKVKGKGHPLVTLKLRSEVSVSEKL
jgi:LCP family protein required for cell wall assembly